VAVPVHFFFSLTLGFADETLDCHRYLFDAQAFGEQGQVGFAPALNACQVVLVQSGVQANLSTGQVMLPTL
jgi:hypothetical protein